MIKLILLGIGGLLIYLSFVHIRFLMKEYSDIERTKSKQLIAVMANEGNLMNLRSTEYEPVAHKYRCLDNLEEFWIPKFNLNETIYINDSCGLSLKGGKLKGLKKVKVYTMLFLAFMELFFCPYINHYKPDEQRGGIE